MTFPVRGVARRYHAGLASPHCCARPAATPRRACRSSSLSGRSLSHAAPCCPLTLTWGGWRLPSVPEAGGWAAGASPAAGQLGGGREGGASCSSEAACSPGLQTKKESGLWGIFPRPCHLPSGGEALRGWGPSQVTDGETEAGQDYALPGLPETPLPRKHLCRAEFPGQTGVDSGLSARGHRTASPPAPGCPRGDLMSLPARSLHLCLFILPTCGLISALCPPPEVFSGSLLPAE